MKRFKGGDRFIMFLCRDIRRRWMQYGENRTYNLKTTRITCMLCQERATEWDHIDPVGTRAYTIEDLVPYIKRMLFNECQPLCSDCNAKKGAKK